MPPHSPSELLQVLERRKNVAQRYLRGQTQWEIACAFEVDQATVSRDLTEIRKAWLASAVRDVNEIKAKELAKIDATEEQAWKAWAKSQENAEVLRAKMRDGSSETEKISKGQAGDPRFLDIVLKCVQRRCEILGVIDPKSPGSNNTVNVFSFDKMVEEIKKAQLTIIAPLVSIEGNDRLAEVERIQESDAGERG